MGNLRLESRPNKIKANYRESERTREREGERETDRQTETDRDRQTDRQTWEIWDRLRYYC